MAWLSAGGSNDELITQMVENGVITTPEIENAFRHTDRGDFVPTTARRQAYIDHPFRQRYLHMSAPHMYVTVLQELELSPGLSFLNIGSGSGYLSCLAACLLGESGLSHGIDVSPDCVKHSEMCCSKWFETLLQKRESGDEQAPVVTKEGVSFVTGNCFNIDIERAVSSCRYDRIYVGAGCPESRKEFFLSLLADDGIMIASINEKNELIKIKRTHRNIFAESHISRVIFAPLIEPPPEQETYELRPTPRERLNSITSVTSLMTGMTTDDGNSSNITSISSSPSSVITFSSSTLSPTPLMTLSVLPNRIQNKVLLPPLLWSPTKTRHRQFSKVFKDAVFTLLCVINRPHKLSDGSTRQGHGILPLPLILYIISYASRDWFVPTRTPLQLMQDELMVEKTLRQAAEQLVEEEKQKRVRIERERDIYKMLVRRMGHGADFFNYVQRRLNFDSIRNLLFSAHDNDDDDTDHIGEDDNNDDDDDEDHHLNHHLHLDDDDDEEEEENGGDVEGGHHIEGSDTDDDEVSQIHDITHIHIPVSTTTTSTTDTTLHNGDHHEHDEDEDEDGSQINDIHSDVSHHTQNDHENDEDEDDGVSADRDHMLLLNISAITRDTSILEEDTDDSSMDTEDCNHTETINNTSTNTFPTTSTYTSNQKVTTSGDNNHCYPIHPRSCANKDGRKDDEEVVVEGVEGETNDSTWVDTDGYPSSKDSSIYPSTHPLVDPYKVENNYTYSHMNIYTRTFIDVHDETEDSPSSRHLHKRVKSNNDFDTSDHHSPLHTTTTTSTSNNIVYNLNDIHLDYSIQTKVSPNRLTSTPNTHLFPNDSIKAYNHNNIEDNNITNNNNNNEEDEDGDYHSTTSFSSVSTTSSSPISTNLSTLASTPVPFILDIETSHMTAAITTTTTGNHTDHILNDNNIVTGHHV